MVEEKAKRPRIASKRSNDAVFFSVKNSRGYRGVLSLTCLRTKLCTFSFRLSCVDATVTLDTDRCGQC